MSERWNGHYYERDAPELDDLSMEAQLQRAFDAGFDAACDIWEQDAPAEHIEDLRKQRRKEVVFNLMR